ncbi:MAG: YdeI/OmpD-associated family protein [Spirochaetales bacterium]|nr:YdeI/OmpD-associated family protein [Spirochaetales bacterium]
MADIQISGGVVHKLPEDLEVLLRESTELYTLWESLTPLGRNEWICWIEDAKREDTRIRRISRLRDQLMEGKRRPCCWPGCPHRKSEK